MNFQENVEMNIGVPISENTGFALELTLIGKPGRRRINSKWSMNCSGL